MPRAVILKQIKRRRVCPTHYAQKKAFKELSDLKLDKASKMSTANKRAGEIYRQIWTITETSERKPGPLFEEADRWAKSRNCQFTSGMEVIPLTESNTLKQIYVEYETIKQAMANLTNLGVDAMFSAVYENEPVEFTANLGANLTSDIFGHGMSICNLLRFKKFVIEMEKKSKDFMSSLPTSSKPNRSVQELRRDFVKELTALFEQVYPYSKFSWKSIPIDKVVNWPLDVHRESNRWTSADLQKIEAVIDSIHFIL